MMLNFVIIEYQLLLKETLHTHIISFVMQERNIRPRNAKDEYAQRIEESIA